MYFKDTLRQICSAVNSCTNNFGLKLGSSKISVRRLSLTSWKQINPKNSEEVKIPVPWGHVAGKWWGKRSVQPIIGVHGWLDNAGSWHRLAEQLDDEYSFLALDLPGSGKSSHLPPLHNYHFSSSAMVIRRVQLHFGLKDIIIFGHSGGSASTFLFSAIYPEVVKAYLGVDYVFYMYRRNKKRAEDTAILIDKLLEVGSFDPKKSRSYDWDTAREAWIAGSILGAGAPELVEQLMERGVIALPDGSYSFSRDIRLKLLKATAIDCFSIEETEALAKNISCHVCYVKSISSPFFEFGIRNHPSIVETIKHHSKSFELVEVDGHHHVHMENPVGVAEVAHNFLKNIK